MYKVFAINIFFSFFLFSTVFCQEQPQQKDTEDTLSQEQKNFELILAAANGSADSVLLWLTRGADVNATSDDNVSSLMYAAQNGSLMVVKVLVVNGADINLHPYSKISPLSSAVINNKMDVVEYLLFKKAEVDVKDYNGITPLMYASAFGYYPIVELLLTNNADKNLKDIYGNDAFMLAVLYEHPDVTELLLQSGSNINTTDLKGFTPTIVAAQNGMDSYFEMFKVFGADFSAKNQYDYNALDVAVINRQKGSVQKLLELDSLKLLQVNQPVKLAYMSGSKEMVPVLRKGGCKPYLWPIFNKVMMGYGIDANFNDLMFGFSLGLRESRYNTLFTVSHFTRYWAKRSLIDYGNDIYFQFWERRSLLSFGIDKRFKLTGEGNKQSGIGVGLKECYTYGHYRGAEILPMSKWMLIPALGYYSEGGSGGISFTFEYTNLSVENIFPVRLNINTYLYIGFRKFSSIKKEPEW